MKLYKSLLTLALTAMAACGFTSCDDEQACPPYVVPEGGIEGTGAWDTPYNVNKVIGIIKADKTDEFDCSNVWVTGYVVGWVNTNISYTSLSERNCTFSVPAEVNSNCLLAATPDETDYNKCVVVQLSTTGDVRSNVNLVDHPDNLGKLVTLRGDVQKYFGKPGLKSTNAFNWDGQGYETAGDDQPQGGDVTFTKAASITSGKAYGIVASGKLAKPQAADKSYGYLYVSDVTVKDDSFKADSSNGFVFTDAGDNSWYISDSYGRFLYMEGTYTSFQLSAQLNKSNANYRWKAEFKADGTCVLTNAGNNNTVQYSSNYTSYGSYSSMQDGGVYPTLYLMDGEPLKLPDLSGDNTPDTPVTPPSGDAGSKENPYTVAQVRAGSLSGTGWVKGVIVGYIPGKVFDEAVFGASGAVATNLLLAESASVTDASQCIPVQLPAAVRAALALDSNPGNLGKELIICGSLENYFGKPGVKSVTEYVLDGTSGGDTPSTPVTPPATGSLTFTKVTAVTDGTYALVNPDNGTVCVPIAQNYTYGYLLTEAASASDANSVTTSAANAFVIKAVAGGYTITDSYGRYLGMDGVHAGSIQLYTAPQSKGETTWTITIESNGQAKITNALSGLFLVWKSQYSNFAPGDLTDSYMPVLYKN